MIGNPGRQSACRCRAERMICVAQADLRQRSHMPN
jgi:hypothetical protein